MNSWMVDDTSWEGMPYQKGDEVGPNLFAINYVSYSTGYTTTPFFTHVRVVKRDGREILTEDISLDSLMRKIPPSEIPYDEKFVTDYFADPQGARILNNIFLHCQNLRDAKSIGNNAEEIAQRSRKAIEGLTVQLN